MANQRYGLPYKGSKNKIAEWVVNCLPPNDNFYDLFCGGCSITHAALKSGKYKRFFANDIIGGLPRLFIKAAHGHIDTDYHFVTREEFFEKKDEDMLIKICYSFGTNGKDYIYGKDIEDFKHAYHDAVVFRRFDALKAYGFDLTNVATQESIRERYVAAKRVLRKRERNVDFITDKNPPHLQGLENQGRIEELESLESLENLPEPEILAQDIVENLEDALSSFKDVLAELQKAE
jgi:hypothetical protein